MTEIETKCDFCGEEIKIDKNRYDEYEHHFCGPECYGNWRSENRCKENSSNWQGGKMNDNYRGYNMLEQREKTLERDDNQCVVCGNDKKLNVHHKVPHKKYKTPKMANKLDNLVTLCAKCHYIIHKKVIEDFFVMSCPHCASTLYHSRKHKEPHYRCDSCGKEFEEPKKRVNKHIIRDGNKKRLSMVDHIEDLDPLGFTNFHKSIEKVE